MSDVIKRGRLEVKKKNIFGVSYKALFKKDFWSICGFIKNYRVSVVLGEIRY